jgi:hypothetical protein
MPIDYEGGGTWLRLPKVGESTDYAEHGNIIKAEKVTGGRYNFTKKVEITQPNGKVVKAEEDLGYHIEFTFEDGSKLSVSSWKPYFALKEANIQEGMAIKVNHPIEGQWGVQVVKSTYTPTDVSAMQDELKDADEEPTPF